MHLIKFNGILRLFNGIGGGDCDVIINFAFSKHKN